MWRDALSPKITCNKSAAAQGSELVDSIHCNNDQACVRAFKQHWEYMETGKMHLFPYDDRVSVFSSDIHPREAPVSPGARGLATLGFNSPWGLKPQPAVAPAPPHTANSPPASCCGPPPPQFGETWASRSSNKFPSKPNRSWTPISLLTSK